MDADASYDDRDDSRMLRQVIEATPNAMIMADHDGRITLVNTQAERLFGYTRAELFAMSVDDLVPDRFRDLHPVRRAGYAHDPETLLVGPGRDLHARHRDGHEFPVEIGLNPVDVDDRPQVLASIVDITERKRAEERLHQVVEAAPNAMIMTNAEGEIVLVNTQAEVSFGYERAELLTMRIDQLVPARHREGHQGDRADYFARPARRDMGAGRELFGLRKDGTEIPIEIGLNPIQIMGEQHVLASVIDITERLLVQEAESADRADRLRRSILDSLPFSIIASDVAGTIVTANPAAERLLGFGRDELVGARVADLRAGVSAAVPLLGARPTGVDEREIDYRRKDGTTLPVNEAVAPITDERGDVSGFLSVAYDITQRREAEAFIRHLAHYDLLTDLPNRTLLLDRLGAEIHAARRRDRRVAVAVLDLDHFKRVNDSFGHHVGDELLLQLGRRLVSHVGPDDVVARLGGDGFALVLTGVEDDAELEARVRGVLDAVPEPFVCIGHELVVTASMGVATFPVGGADPAALLKHAGTAMYHAKTSTRNSFQWFRDSMLDEADDKLALAAGLRHALDSDAITVEYQPQVRLATGEVVGVEALARWHSPDGTTISPDRFIPVAEDNGLIIPLGRRVLRTACHDAVAMSADLGRPLKVAVNVSPRQIHDPEWLDILRAALADSGLPPERLEIEITEGIFMQDPREVVELLETVRALGVAIVVDDFGTGFSSLAYLTRFPIDKLKIDRSFVGNLVCNGTDAAIVDTIIMMAHTLGMDVVGEGVETTAQETYLRERGCDEGQGFLYSRAVPAPALRRAVG
jgi:diguanylate cyclase (GGDEF)-like protein/PAS domain S-box-containing protein